MEFPERKRDLWGAKYDMLGFTLQQRDSGLIVAVCSHGFAHPIPEAVRLLDAVGPESQQGTWTIHKCDGCCSVFKP